MVKRSRITSESSARGFAEHSGHETPSAIRMQHLTLQLPAGTAQSFSDP
jgi:hypothetical protein